MSNPDAVMSSRMWSERLNMPLPSPLLWGLYELIVEAEFVRRMGISEMEGTA